MPFPEDCPNGYVRGPLTERYEWMDPMFEIANATGGSGDVYTMFYNAVGQGAGQLLIDLDVFCQDGPPIVPDISLENLLNADIRYLLIEAGASMFFERKCQCG